MLLFFENVGEYFEYGYFWVGRTKLNEKIKGEHKLKRKKQKKVPEKSKTFPNKIEKKQKNKKNKTK